MSKLETLNQKSMTPKWILHHVLEDIDQVEGVAVIIYGNDGQISVTYSNQKSEKLYAMFVKFQAYINQHALEDD